MHNERLSCNTLPHNHPNLVVGLLLRALVATLAKITDFEIKVNPKTWYESNNVIRVMEQLLLFR